VDGRGHKSEHKLNIYFNYKFNRKAVDNSLFFNSAVNSDSLLPLIKRAIQQFIANI